MANKHPLKADLKPVYVTVFVWILSTLVGFYWRSYLYGN